MNIWGVQRIARTVPSSLDAPYDPPHSSSVDVSAPFAIKVFHYTTSGSPSVPFLIGNVVRCSSILLALRVDFLHQRKDLELYDVDIPQADIHCDNEQRRQR
jgi:hypothetical protein